MVKRKSCSTLVKASTAKPVCPTWTDFEGLECKLRYDPASKCFDLLDALQSVFGNRNTAKKALYDLRNKLPGLMSNTQQLRWSGSTAPVASPVAPAHAIMEIVKQLQLHWHKDETRVQYQRPVQQLCQLMQQVQYGSKSAPKSAAAVAEPQFEQVQMSATTTEAETAASASPDASSELGQPEPHTKPADVDICAKRVDTVHVQRVEPTWTTFEGLEGRVRYDPASKCFDVLDCLEMVLGNRSTARSALETLRTTSQELVLGTDKLRWAGSFSPTPSVVAPAAAIVRILMQLNSRRAAGVRAEAAETLCRRLGGDLSLAADVQRCNTEVAGTEAQATLLHGTRVSVDRANQPVAVGAPVDKDVQLLMMMPEQQRAAAARRLLDTEMHEREMRLQEMAMRQLSRVNDVLARSWQSEALSEVDRIFVKDAWANNLRHLTQASTGQRLALTDGSDVCTKGRPICIDGEARQLGYTLEQARCCRMRVGRELAALYRHRHGRDPPQCETLVNGRPMMVYQYWQQDADLMHHAIEQVMGVMGAVPRREV